MEPVDDIRCAFCGRNGADREVDACAYCGRLYCPEHGPRSGDGPFCRECLEQAEDDLQFSRELDRCAREFAPWGEG